MPQPTYAEPKTVSIGQPLLVGQDKFEWSYLTELRDAGLDSHGNGVRIYWAMAIGRGYK